jgi:hypothetical protein
MNDDGTKPISPPKPEGDPIKPLRTYEGDVAEVLANRKSSTISIALAESRKNTGEERLSSNFDAEDTSASKKKIFIALISLFLIGIGVVGAYYLYSISPLASTPHAAQTIEAASSLIPSDAQRSISIDNMSSASVINAVRTEIAKPQDANTIKEIVLVQTENNQRFRVAAPDMIKTMDINVPDILSRTITDDWMLGVYADANGTKTAFVVVNVDYFQNAFAGMLQWEKLMADDLKQYLYENTPSDITAATQDTSTNSSSTPINPLENIEGILPSTVSSTSSQPKTNTHGILSEGGPERTSDNSPQTSFTSTTPSEITDQTTEINPGYAVLSGSFVDRIIQNKDVREFVTSDGNILFLYSFIDEKRLVVAGSEAALTEVLNRLEQQAFVR